MNKIFLHLWLFTLGSSILHSCTQNEAIPDVESQDQENEITFQANEGASRAFIGSNLSTNGTTMCIYGYKGDTPLAQGTDKELVGKTLKYNGESWAVVDSTGNPITYFWEGAGTYRFFGYLTYDGAHNSQNTFFTSYSDSVKKLTISDTIDSNHQFDYLYSELDLRTMDANNNSAKGRAVSFNMKHLLTAFSIGAENTTDEQVTVLKMALEGVHSQGSAIIDYSGSSVQTTYEKTYLGRTPTTPFIIYNDDEGYVLENKDVTDRNKVGNVFTGSAEKTYHMIWPQDSLVVSPTNQVLNNPDRKFEATDSILVVEYKMGNDATIHKKRIKFPDADWKAGKKYHFNVLFADQMVTVKAMVNPWDYSSSNVNFKDKVVSVVDDGELKWDASAAVVDDNAKTVTIANNKAVTASFAINTPQGARWRVTLEGDTQAFAFKNNSTYSDYATGPVDGYIHHIQIVPKINDPSCDYTAQLKFVVITADETVIACDGILQKPQKYTLILPSAN